MTVNVSSDLTDIPGYLFTEDEDPLFGPGVEPNAKNAAFKIDILGEMQIQGTVAETPSETITETPSESEPEPVKEASPRSKRQNKKTEE